MIILWGVLSWSVHYLFRLSPQVVEQGAWVTEVLKDVFDVPNILSQKPRDADSGCSLMDYGFKLFISVGYTVWWGALPSLYGGDPVGLFKSATAWISSTYCSQTKLLSAMFRCSTSRQVLECVHIHVLGIQMGQTQTLRRLSSSIYANIHFVASMSILEVKADKIFTPYPHVN